MAKAEKVAERDWRKLTVSCMSFPVLVPGFVRALITQNEANIENATYRNLESWLAISRKRKTSPTVCARAD